jgi:hypothetical protein
MQAIAQTSEPDTADRKYFTLAPNLLFALCRDPFDLAVWLAVKLVAGDTGTCTLSAEDGTALTGMSAGKWVDSQPLAVTWLWTFCHFETHGKHIYRGLGSCL